MSETENRSWWHDEPAATKIRDVHGPMLSYASWLQQTHAPRYFRERVLEGLYDTGGGMQSMNAAMAILKSSGFTAARLNVTRSIVDTLCAKIGKGRPAIKVKPSDADFTIKRKARRLSRFLRGKNDEMDVHEVAPMVFRDCEVVGTGIAKVSEEHGEIVIDRVLREELFVDPREARYGKPRQLFQRKTYAREVLSELFPKFRGQIRDAAPADTQYEDSGFEESRDSDVVEVWEAWHLPSAPDAKDGRWAVAIDGVTLSYRAWERPRFPFAFMRYNKPRKGFWGVGLVDELAEIQWKITETVRDIQEALYYGSQLKIIAPRQAKVNKNHLGRAQRASFIEVDGSPSAIQWVAPNPVSKDQLAFLQMLIQQAHDLTGISMMAAQAKNPLGANASGAALQEFYDIESERYANVEQEYARWHVSLDECVIDTAKQIANDPDKKVTARWNKRDVMETIDWGDVDMKRDQYRLTLEPSNFLPDTRAGQLDGAEKLAQAGVITGPWVSALVASDAPDLERANRYRNAPLEYLEYIMERLEDEDVAFEECLPDAFMDLAMAQEMAKGHLAMIIMDEAPEAIRQRFRDFIDFAYQTETKASAAAPPPGAPPMPGAEMMPPGGDPMMPPSGGPPGSMPMEMAGALSAGTGPTSLPGAALPGMDGVV